MEKRCTKCGQLKPPTEFDRSGGNGRMSYCMACRREKRRAAYVPHPEPRVTVEKGQRFGRLTVVEETPPRSTHRRVTCVCDCGTETNTMLHSLVKGETTSCGCYHREMLAEINRSAEHRAAIVTHGLSNHPLHGTWTGMIARCENPDHHAFKNYGGRGIKVRPEWHDVAVYVAWIEANLGPRPEGLMKSGRPEYSLDRIDNDRHYEPGNLRWATRSEQQQNRRRPRKKRDADST